VSASPFVFYYYGGENEEYFMTFVNISLFYNILNRVSRKLILGPFVSVNAINYNDPLYFDFRSGLNFYLRNIDNFYKVDTIFNIDVLLIELGYRFNSNRHGFYFHVGLDFIAALKFFAASSADFDKYEERQRWY